MTETLSSPHAEYREHLEAGRFMIQRSRSTGGHVFYPRVLEPRTGAMDLEWVEASGRGTVHASTVARMKPPTPSYNVALIDLEEGPRMMSRVEGIAPEDVRAGMAVQAHIVTEDDQPLVVFRPA
ncbi:hypothetical protein A6768_12525 [Sphingobium yanoikuyae]|uniref:ChsH2 C-terminal OB-fold domain-containing protein n=2 Tax=Sphingobium yanoikuyae TaxID=13690 RepID=A0A291N081_SPHYA|nr:hypothetical protein A6768_12525 [Sphingobium yanoikuyae]